MDRFVVLALVLLRFSLLSMAETSHTARRKLTKDGMAFKRGQLEKPLFKMKLILGTQGDIYAGGDQHLSHLVFPENQRNAVVKKIPIECDKRCPITVMQPGRDAYPLFVCTEKDEGAHCCYKDVNGLTHHCKDVYGGGEPALLTGDFLYTTLSGVKDKDGIYRKRLSTDSDNMTPPSSRTDQRYVKIIERRNKMDDLQDKLYAFYTEKNQDQNSDIFTPRVSQICKADLGGSKDTLQFQWTSQLSSRLSCGDPSRKLYYTELLDVAMLPSEDGGDDRVYGLFKKRLMRAVCVYAMKDIDSTFSSSTTEPTETLSKRPGECVQDSKRLPSNLLKYMKRNPEMANWVRPIGNSNPLLVSRRHYSHIQVDRVGGTVGQEGHKVLLLSMESGVVHKVLENSTSPFIIAEYHPFESGTQILSMLLDNSEKKLYVSSSHEVVQIELRNCSVYGNQCTDCVLARDPYCGWDSGRKTCAPYSDGLTQDVLNGNYHDCTPYRSAPFGSGVDKPVPGPPSKDVPESSRHYLSCPIDSHHATYRWLKDGEERQSLEDQKQEQLVLLIEGMGSADEGGYECVAQEGDYQKTVAHYQLRMTSGVAGLKSSPLALALLALLLTLTC
ncbi:semaphorin-7A-like [Alosa alosa]|uniref:semaphorin-7A-like n=1 Tax=Alosa alosa TaxID=278164 RepID=UPI0020154534|nr:semaphorin-7A-like [Alosa alosa]